MTVAFRPDPPVDPDDPPLDSEPGAYDAWARRLSAWAYHDPAYGPCPGTAVCVEPSRVWCGHCGEVTVVGPTVVPMRRRR
jgi:hypothetical protein